MRVSSIRSAVSERVDRATVVTFGVIGAVVLVSTFVLPHVMTSQSPSGQWETPLPIVTLGTIIGLTYGLLGVGLLLIYRTSRIINFAHGEMGAFAAAFFGIAAARWHLPYWVAFPIGIAVGGGVGALAELAVMRRLRKAPALMSVVATLGIGQFLVQFAFAFNSQAQANGALFPQPSGLPVFNIGALRVTPAYSAMLILGPIAVGGLVWFLKRSRYGMGIRAASDNPEAARMSGVFATRMSSLAWALAGGLAAFTAILTQPTQGFVSQDTFGPGLLLRALAAAVVARMSSMPLALAAGVGLGVLEQVLTWNFPQSGVVSVALFAIILLALLVQRQRPGREEERGSWAAVEALRPLPEALRTLWVSRNLGRVLAGVALAVGLALPFVINNGNAATVMNIYAFTIVGLSLGVVTGLAGQLSLGQFAVAAIGALVSFTVSSHGGFFLLAVVYGGMAAAAVSLVLGLPALRIRGLLLTITTLSFALIVPGWLLTQPWAFGSGVSPPVPVVLGHAIDTGKEYYWIALAMLMVTIWLAANIRRSGFGRLMVAVRDNEDNARSFTVRPFVVKMQAFLFAGLIAGVGGALYAHGHSSIDAASFPTSASIDVVKMLVIGGVGVLAGPLLGSLFVIGIPAFVPLDTAELAATAFGQLLIIMYLPGGLAQLVGPMRDRIIRWSGRRAGIDVDAAFALERQTAAASPDGEMTRSISATRTLVADQERRRRRPGAPLLEAVDLRKHFGGIRAVDGVSLEVRAGEIVGLIGPNGAGKTTTFELLGGFARPDTGRIVFDGDDVTSLGPEARGQLGLIRSFQDAALFPTMTVEETIKLALERVLPTRILPSALGLAGSERTKSFRARELIDLMGLGAYHTRQIRELSTGTRRIVELTCLIALQPTLLLLDEPSSGIAQRETESLGALLRDIKRDLDMTLLVIEHDIPLIMGLAHRVIAMANGRILAAGTPAEVRSDPLVVEAYLGGSDVAIERSGAERGSRLPAPT